jgi:hypothetical protein
MGSYPLLVEVGLAGEGQFEEKEIEELTAALKAIPFLVLASVERTRYGLKLKASVDGSYGGAAAALELLTEGILADADLADDLVISRIHLMHDLD